VGKTQTDHGRNEGVEKASACPVSLWLQRPHYLSPALGEAACFPFDDKATLNGTGHGEEGEAVSVRESGEEASAGVTGRDVKEGEAWPSDDSVLEETSTSTSTSTSILTSSLTSSLISILTGMANESIFCDDYGEEGMENGKGSEGSDGLDPWKAACDDGDFCYADHSGEMVYDTPWAYSCLWQYPYL
jgi:hypothetical protein